MEPRQLVSFDWAIKHILRNKADYRVLGGFLSELFLKDVVVQAVLESSSNANSVDDKTNSVDVKVSINNGEIVIVEIQFLDEYDFFKRINYGASKAVTEQLHKGGHYNQIKKVYSVDIVYFDLGTGTDYVYQGKTEFRGLHKNDVLQLSEKQKDLFHIDAVSDDFPEYYLIDVAKYKNELKDKLDEWIYYFKNSEVPKTYSAKGLDLAESDLDYLNLSEEERKIYDRKLNQDRLAWSIAKTAEMKEELEKKREEAFAKKEAELAKNEERVKQQQEIIAQKEETIAKNEAAIVEKDAKLAKKDANIAEKDAKLAKAKQDIIEAARKLKAKGMSIEDIAEITGLRAEDI
ncbi:hypothetical protein AGMMS49938_15750 [Fibrobacterales bacterium]|nr:hypothetical protein AGMMS49938_15750 [Fibrobacterales bacterium]